MGRAFALLIALTSFCAPAAAQTKSGGIEVREAWARVANGQTSVYLTIVNHTGTDDALLSVTSPAADRLILQKMSVKNLAARRKGLASIGTPAMSATRLSPSAQYIAVEGLHEPLRPGQSIPVTLVFQHAGQIETVAPVGNQELGNRGR